jgi:hypothetical protein
VPTLLEFATDEQIRQEYQKSFMLNMFRKICVNMKNDPKYKVKIQTLFRESHNKCMTTQIIIKNKFNYDLTFDEAKIMSSWFAANLKKSNQRKRLPLSLKIELFDKQNGKCAVCGEDLGNDWSKIHVDHIIPWTLVGDELENNYQNLCETCNECKSASTDYIFKNLIKLI